MFGAYVNLFPFHLSYVIHMQRRWFQTLKDVIVSFSVPGYVLRHGHAETMPKFNMAVPLKNVHSPKSLDSGMIVPLSSTVMPPS